ncbi:MAG: hypothetical protein GX257_10185 [Clostridiales bacterium]|nr:hypothetical protein [Clostridiales bacterium]
MKAFDKNKKYIFSKAKWLMDTGNVWTYESYQSIRDWADKADGQEVVNISADGTVGYVNKHIVTPESCDIIKSNRRTTLRNAVKCLLLMDKHAQLHEVINMLCMDKKRLERRLKAINKELAQKELELHKVEKELMKWIRS